MKHLLKLSDCTRDEIMDIIRYAGILKQERKNGIPHRHLEGKILGMIFKKSSTRTRVSFEAGMVDLGGHAMFISDRDSQMGRGELVEDTARVLSRYLDAIMIRTFDQAEVEGLAHYGAVPVINGLTDEAHPCQVLADLMTIREYKGALPGIKLCFIGDGNNMVNSLIAGCLLTGMEISVACPKAYWPQQKVLDWVANKKFPAGAFTLTEDVAEAVKDADVVYTDVWASMGQEDEADARVRAFAGYQVNREVMAMADRNAMVLHCLPAHRGEEITADMFEIHAGEIFDQAENRLHVQKSVLCKLIH